MVSSIFQIYSVQGYGAGMLALCPQPATDADFAKIAHWHPSVVVTLTTETEFPNTGPFLPQRFLEAECDWLHLPISDFGTPGAEDHMLWHQSLQQILAVLNSNGRILVHCKGGQGRSGMVILRLLTLQGEDGHTALKRIRDIRTNAVETDAQFIWATKGL